MQRVGIREFRDHLTRYLAAVREGHGLVITDRDQPVAQVLPIGSSDAAAVAGLVPEGLVEWSGGKPRGVDRPIEPRGGLVSDLVVESRR